MDPRKRFKPSHDRDDRDRDGPGSGVNQVNPHDTPNTRQSGEKGHQGGEPDEVKPRALQPNRDRQPDLPRDTGFDADDPRELRRRGKKARSRDER